MISWINTSKLFLTFLKFTAFKMYMRIYTTLPLLIYYKQKNPHIRCSNNFFNTLCWKFVINIWRTADHELPKQKSGELFWKWDIKYHIQRVKLIELTNHSGVSILHHKIIKTKNCDNISRLWLNFSKCCARNCLSSRINDCLIFPLPPCVIISLNALLPNELKAVEYLFIYNGKIH